MGESGFFAGFFGGAFEEEEVRDFLFIGPVGLKTFFEEGAKLFVQPAEFFKIFFFDLREGFEDSADEVVTNFFELWVLLQNFAGDVEGEVGGIDNAFDEAEIAG